MPRSLVPDARDAPLPAAAGFLPGPRLETRPDPLRLRGGGRPLGGALGGARAGLLEPLLRPLRPRIGPRADRSGASCHARPRPFTGRSLPVALSRTRKRAAPGPAR